MNDISVGIDILALLSFLITWLVITRLTTRVHKEVATSDRQRLQFNQLYELAQQLLALDPNDAILPRSVERFRDVFRLGAVCLFDAVDTDCYCSGNTRSALNEKTRAVYWSGRDSDDITQGVLIRCLRAAGKTVGAVGFEGLYDAELTIGPLSALAAAMLERMHAFHAASRAALPLRRSAPRRSKMYCPTQDIEGKCFPSSGAVAAIASIDRSLLHKLSISDFNALYTISLRDLYVLPDVMGVTGKGQYGCNTFGRATVS